MPETAEPSCGSGARAYSSNGIFVLPCRADSPGERSRMNNHIARRLSGVAAFVVVAAASGIAEGQSANFGVSATCSGGGQLCNNVPTIQVFTTGLLQAQYFAD